MMKDKIAMAITIALFSGAAWAAGEGEKGAMQGAPEDVPVQHEISPTVEPVEAQTAEPPDVVQEGAPMAVPEQHEISPTVDPLPSQTPGAEEQTLVKEGAPPDVPVQHEISPTVDPLPSQTPGAEGGMEKKMDLQALDADDDGYVSESEAGTWPELAGRFGDLDANGDGRLDEDEFSKFEMEMHGVKEGAPADVPMEHKTGTATQ